MDEYKTWEEASYGMLVALTAPLGDLGMEDFDPRAVNRVLAELKQEVGMIVRNNPTDPELVSKISSIGMIAYIILCDMEQYSELAMHDLLVAKQNDYGHKNINEFGIIGLAIRMSDKIARYQNLENRTTNPYNEPLIDTLYDLIGYATIGLMLETGTFNLQLAKDLP